MFPAPKSGCGLFGKGATFFSHTPCTTHMPAKVAKTWDLTLNNYTDEDIEKLKLWEPEVTRMVVAKEVGESGTPHLQIKITFKRAYRFAAIKKLMGKAHIEESKVDLDFLYCMKLDGDVVINVDNRKQGTRSDLKRACDALKEGASIMELTQDHTEVMVKYGVGMERVARRLRGQNMTRYHGPWPWPMLSDWSTTHVLEGPPNIGKTQFAKAHFENPLLVSHMDMLLDFDPSVHAGIIFDDLSVAHMPRNSQIHLVDIDEPRAIHCRYSCAQIPANTRKIFTCNPGFFPFTVGDAAINRRVTVTEVGKGNTSFAPISVTPDYI